MALTAATTAGAAGGGYQLSQAIMQIYSKEIFMWAQPILKFEQFVVRKEELGVAPGLTMNILRYNNLGGSSDVLTEGVRMQTRTLSASQIQITVVEHGDATAVTELQLQASFDDTMSSGAKLLGMKYAKLLDAGFRDNFLGCQNVVYAADASGRNDLATGDVFDTNAIKNAVETLKTNDAPQLASGYYVCFAHPHQLRGLKDDPSWISASHYGATQQIFRGEAGRFEDTIFVETTMMSNGVPINGAASPNKNLLGYDSTLDPAVTGTLGTTVYKAVMFGDNAVGWAVSMPVEMRDNGIQDFGREHGLAYYGIWGSAILTNPNIVRIETA